MRKAGSSDTSPDDALSTGTTLPARHLARRVPVLLDVWLSRLLGRPPKYLPILLLFVTEKCNLRCRMCGVWEHADSAAKAGELTTDEWKAVIRSAAALRTFLMSITGGEALLRPDVFELIRYAKQHGMSVHLCSNGTLLNDEIVDEIRESDLDTVSISIDGHRPEIHDRLRGAGTLDQAVRGIRLIRQRAPSVKVGINFLISAENFIDMCEMIPFAEGLDVHQIKFAPIHRNLQHKDKRLETFGSLVFTDEHLHSLRIEIDKLVEAASKSRLQTTSKRFLDGILDFYRQPDKGFRCYAGHAVSAINPQGLIAPCCDMWGDISVRDAPLEDIWRSDAFQRLRTCVRTCERPCWDTTNAELSLRMSVRSTLGGLGQTWRDLRFYFGSGRR